MTTTMTMTITIILFLQHIREESKRNITKQSKVSWDEKNEFLPLYLFDQIGFDSSVINKILN